jgi:hypothetical protein
MPWTGTTSLPGAGFGARDPDSTSSAITQPERILVRKWASIEVELRWMIGMGALPDSNESF